MSPAIVALMLEIMVKFGIPAMDAAVKLWYIKDPTQANWDTTIGLTQKSFADHIRGPQPPTL